MSKMRKKNLFSIRANLSFLCLRVPYEIWEDFTPWDTGHRKLMLWLRYATGDNLEISFQPATTPYYLLPCNNSKEVYGRRNIRREGVFWCSSSWHALWIRIIIHFAWLIRDLAWLESVFCNSQIRIIFFRFVNTQLQASSLTATRQRNIH